VYQRGFRLENSSRTEARNFVLGCFISEDCSASRRAHKRKRGDCVAFPLLPCFLLPIPPRPCCIERHPQSACEQLAHTRSKSVHPVTGSPCRKRRTHPVEGRARRHRAAPVAAIIDARAARGDAAFGGDREMNAAAEIDVIRPSSITIKHREHIIGGAGRWSVASWPLRAMISARRKAAGACFSRSATIIAMRKCCRPSAG
jgi:hypothetical protein